MCHVCWPFMLQIRAMDSGVRRPRRVKSTTDAVRSADVPTTATIRFTDFRRRLPRRSAAPMVGPTAASASSAFTPARCDVQTSASPTTAIAYLVNNVVVMLV